MSMSLEILADAGKWLTTGVLFLFSIMNIAIIVERIFFYRNENKSSAAAKADECIRMLKEKAYGDAVKACTGISNGIIHLIMVTATFLLGDDSPAADTSILELELENSLSLERMRSEKYVSILGSTGAVSPLIGLFGTVLGIMKSFAGISSGSAHGAGMLQTVSAGIWEALYTTAFGILVAVPALMLYNYFINKANNRLELLENMANNMLIIARKNRS